jgi:predicted phosphodiesterase
MKPIRRKTRFVCLSDTHNASPVHGSFKLPKGDVLIHAGDLTNQGSISELRKTVDWLEKADFEAKIVIAGRSRKALLWLSQTHCGR